AGPPVPVPPRPEDARGLSVGGRARALALAQARRHRRGPATTATDATSRRRYRHDRGATGAHLRRRDRTRGAVLGNQTRRGRQAVDREMKIGIHLPQFGRAASPDAIRDAPSGGRVTVAVGVGWSEAEFDALGQPFHNRGRRTDEIIDALRACWRDDPSSFAGEFYAFDDVRVLPKPAHDIPIWVGGSADATYRRAVARGDGFHAIGLDTDGVAAAVARIRRDRPDESFTISLRTGWDPQGMDPDRIRRERAEWEAAGLQHVVAGPWP